jgi:tRNA(adenine34) deaminase
LPTLRHFVQFALDGLDVPVKAEAHRYGAAVDAGLGELMELALEEARAAPAHGDVPVGAVVAGPGGEVLARRHNERELVGDPTAHAELLALRDAAGGLGRWRLDDCILVSTLEPCPMCAGAAVAARIGTVVFGAPDPKAGACGSLYNLGADPRLNHDVTIIPGVREAEAAALLRSFFAERRLAAES